ncbi:MAG: hypothetical protein JOZ41_08170 [Chloroflexi bacterium]|nr:hypothetical protein [Chloroflexota bacterium]
MFYAIQIQGHLDGGWSEWFEGMTITTLDSGDSVLTGDVVDQAALLGLLIKLRDLGLPLVAVHPTSPRHPPQYPTRPSQVGHDAPSAAS